MKNVKKVLALFYLAIFFSFGFLTIFLVKELKPKYLEFIVFDIGQGDAILIRTPQRRNILIDGGPDNLVVYKLGEYLPFYDRQIDLMVLTHPHSDHLVGLIEVLNRYRVKKVLMTGVFYDSAEYFIWLDLIKEKNIPIEIADHRGRFILENDVWLDILFPDFSLAKKEIKNLNNSSIVAKLVYASTTVILTGDFEDEENLITLDLKSDILKVGHHGSDTANSFGFLEAVDPAIAVISYGQDNKFGHPHQQTVENLKRLGVEVFLTCPDGDFFRSLKKN